MRIRRVTKSFGIDIKGTKGQPVINVPKATNLHPGDRVTVVVEPCDTLILCKELINPDMKRKRKRRFVPFHKQPEVDQSREE